MPGVKAHGKIAIHRSHIAALVQCPSKEDNFAAMLAFTGHGLTRVGTASPGSMSRMVTQAAGGYKRFYTLLHCCNAKMQESMETFFLENHGVGSSSRDLAEKSYNQIACWFQISTIHFPKN